MRKLFFSALALTAMFAAPAASRPRNTDVVCSNNLKNIGTALEMYATDFQGHYPQSLQSLTPNYLKTIPCCPKARTDTYSPSFVSRENPDQYVVYCCGDYHSDKGVATNHPLYNSRDGLVEQPPHVSLSPCQENLKKTARLIEQYRAKNKALPKKLSLVSAPNCGGHEYLYDPAANGKTYTLACGGMSVHVADRVRPFQPRWDSASRKLESDATPTVPPGNSLVDDFGPNQAVLGALTGFSLLLAVVALGPRPKKALP